MIVLFSSPLSLPAQVAGLSLTLCLAYAAGLAYWRIFRHPLASFPGPKLAAVTRLYEIYFDVWKGGQYIWEIRRLHEVYGPIVRVAPDELHINDPDFLDNIYSGWGRPRDKHHFQVSNIPNTIFGAEFHADHRRRRQVYSAFFTKQSIRRLEPFVADKLERLHARIADRYEKSQTVNLTYALFGWACDTISFICFGKDWQHVEHPDFNRGFADASVMLLQSFKVLTHVKWVIPIIISLPADLVRPFHSSLALILEYKPRIRNAVLEMMERNAQSQETWSRKALPTNVLHYIQQDDAVDPDLKTADQLAHDAELLVGAGEGTVSSVVLYAFAYLHLNPTALLRLRAELDEAASALHKSQEHLSWAELERLPYLTACLKEALRLQHGITKRMPRIAPTEDLQFGEYIIPRGTPMSTMAPLIHLNATVFPWPESYIPERWLDEDQMVTVRQRDQAYDISTTHDLPVDKLRVRSIPYMHSKIMAFSRGSRICLGMDLAWAEMYLALSSLLRSFDFELYETDVRDVAMYADKVILCARPGSKGIQVRVTKRRDIYFKHRSVSAE